MAGRRVVDVIAGCGGDVITGGHVVAVVEVVDTDRAQWGDDGVGRAAGVLERSVVERDAELTFERPVELVGCARVQCRQHRLLFQRLYIIGRLVVTHRLDTDLHTYARS